jgi:peptide/nickel transport system substrate-binding protein
MSILYHFRAIFYQDKNVRARTISPLFAVKTLAVLVLFCAVACSEHSRRADVTGGTLVISTTADPGTLFPPLLYMTQGKQIAEQLYDYLADVGPEMNTRGDKGFRPQLADDWRWSSDSLSIAFHINPRARWHDGERVIARDVQFTFALNKNPGLGGNAMSELDNIDSVSTADSLTPVFWFHQRLPTQFLDAAAQMLVLPAHQLEKIPAAELRERSPPPIGSGRFRLRRWDKGASIEIVADSANYRGRARLDRVVWTISPDFQTAVTKLFGGDADLFDALRPENVRELARHRNLHALIIPGTDYNFLQFNLRDPKNNASPHPLFVDRNLRRAIAMSIDRHKLVANVLDTLGVVGIGPTVRAFPTTDPHIPQIPFDSAKGARLLDSLGWVRPAPRGIRMKGGRELAFRILVPTSSLNRIRMAVLLQAQLRDAGIRVNVESMDMQAFSARQRAHDFDAELASFHNGASPDGTREAWTSAGVGKDGANYGTYDNPVFDSQFDSAIRADALHAREQFTRAYATINQDAPAVWLYEPKAAIGLNRRIRTSWMRPDAWWSDLGNWYIPPAERIPRDWVGPGR